MLVFGFLLAFLTLNNDEGELIVECGGDQYFIFLGFEAHEGEFIFLVEVSYCIFGFGDKLWDELCKFIT